MNYKRLLKKITHKDYMGGTFNYQGCSVNVILGGDSLNVHIEDRNRTRAEFDFTFDIPRFVIFHDTDKRISNCICRNLNAIHNAQIRIYPKGCAVNYKSK